MTLEEMLATITKQNDSLRSDLKAFGFRLDSIEQERGKEDKEEDEKQIRKECARMDGEEDEKYEERLDKHRKDAEEAEKKREESKKDDYESRMDGESDDDYKCRMDDFQSTMKHIEGEGYDAEAARKIAASIGRKALGEKEMARRSAEARKDGESEEERRKREEDERRDSADSADMKARLDRMERAMKPLSHEDEIELAKAQTRADEVYQHLGDRAPKPLAGMNPIAYRKMLAAKLQVHSKAFGKIDLRMDSITGEAFDAIEQSIYNDAVAFAQSPGSAKPGVLIPIVRTDEAGRRITTYADGSDMNAWLGHFKMDPVHVALNRNPGRSIN